MRSITCFKFCDTQNYIGHVRTVSMAKFSTTVWCQITFFKHDDISPVLIWHMYRSTKKAFLWKCDLVWWQLKVAARRKTGTARKHVRKVPALRAVFICLSFLKEFFLSIWGYIFVCEWSTLSVLIWVMSCYNKPVCIVKPPSWRYAWRDLLNNVLSIETHLM
jgi:hypothetical protein